MKDVKREFPSIPSETRVQFAQELLPTLWKAKDAGEDMELAGWKWFLHFIDERLGKERFEKLVDQYMSERQNSQAARAEEPKK